ncbi:hypothetical protein FOZ63_027986, partial [Perkinsus olseni]
LVYVDDVTVAYTAAHYVILYNTETKTQRLLPCHSGALGVTCMAVCPSRRYLAVAESFPTPADQHSEASDGTPTAPTVTVYDLRCKGDTIRKRRILSIHPRTHEQSEAPSKHPQTPSRSPWPTSGCVTAISFPADGKSLITISTTPAAGSSMCCWLGHWRLDKVAAGASRLLAWTKIAPPITGTTRKMSIRRLASQSITSVGTKSMPALSGTAGVAIVHDAACHPTDAAIVSIIGEGIFKLYRIGDGVMKPLPVQPANKNREGENTNFNFTCQAWLAEGCLLIGSEKGELFLYESNGEFKGTVSTGPGEHRSCLCAVATAKGFVLGGVDSTMRVYERSLDSKE